jgi:hypothetical protein
VRAAEEKVCAARNELRVESLDLLPYLFYVVTGKICDLHAVSILERVLRIVRAAAEHEDTHTMFKLPFGPVRAIFPAPVWLRPRAGRASGRFHQGAPNSKSTEMGLGPAVGGIAAA